MWSRVAAAMIGTVVTVLVSMLSLMKVSGAFATHACPEGWQLHAVTGNPQAKQLLGCSLGTASISVEWSARGSGQAPAGIPATASHETEGTNERWIVTEESEGPKLLADVYFLSAGRRYGMLSIVHGPDSTFSTDAVLAPWLETIEGTAPWGSPQESDLHAQCPAGFQTMANSAPRMVVRCITSPGTTQFTLLQLLWSEGGFGSEADRARLAGDIAQRVASAGGGNARVLEQPTSYTRARNVDAMRAKFETDEKLTLTRANQWTRSISSGNLGVWYRGPMDPVKISQAEGLLTGMSYRRIPRLAFASIFALGVIAAMLVAEYARRKRPLVVDSSSLPKNQPLPKDIS